MGRGRSGVAKNTFKSDYGFANVGVRKVTQTMSGPTSVGSVTPKVSDVQRYLDTGKFDNYGSSASSKKMIASKISSDMNGRGFEVTRSDDGTKLVLGEDGTNIVMLSYSNKTGRWTAKTSRSAGTRRRGGMRGALSR